MPRTRQQIRKGMLVIESRKWKMENGKERKILMLKIVLQTIVESAKLCAACVHRGRGKRTDEKLATVWRTMRREVATPKVAQ